MDERDYYGQPKRRSFLPTLLVVVLAFALGIGITAIAVMRVRAVATWVHPATTTAPVQPIVSRPSPVIVQPAPSTDPALPGRVDAIEGRLAGVEGRVDAAIGDADRAEGLLVAFAARRALDRAQPLGFLEALLRERFAKEDAASVAQVIAASQRPVTLSGLQQELDALRPTLVSKDPEEGMWTGMRRELASLFVIRRADTPSQAPTDRYSRAARALQQGEVDVAASEIARMPGATAAAAWLAQARRYVLARNALDRLETAALLAPRPRSPLSSSSN
mgnify:CR=1 FL=1